MSPPRKAESTSEVKREDSALMERGAAVIALLESRDPEAIVELERYTEQFSAWEVSFETRIGGSDPKDSIKEVGGRIAEQHATVIRLAEEMKDQVVHSLKSLRKKGKGVLAYADHLPKKISTIRSRKG